jgi:sigma-B regulation protein RsbU (phosphoserine phosphatase)
MLPAESVGGDYYDIAIDQSGNLWFGIGDVSGHGITPGLIMMMTQTIHTTITTNYQTTPREMINMINKVLIKNVQGRLKESHFMTLTTLKYHGMGFFEYAGAHLDMIVYRKKMGQCELIPTRGLWLNVIPNIESVTENDSLYLDTGDILVLYTDGIIEAKNHRNQFIGKKQLINIVERYVNHDIVTMCDKIIADVLHWCNEKQKDDITIMAIRKIQ